LYMTAVDVIVSTPSSSLGCMRFTTRRFEMKHCGL